MSFSVCSKNLRDRQFIRTVDVKRVGVARRRHRHISTLGIRCIIAECFVYLFTGKKLLNAYLYTKGN
ncbi:hypothetical protein N0Y54_19675 [Nostoc punctiforme UO1]|uniref:hypothetical protein n=1 Tax=Nostoc punctiforme TaxID=272131 RepID=UPI00309AA812